jgi:hypothetical protein
MVIVCLHLNWGVKMDMNRMARTYGSRYNTYRDTLLCGRAFRRPVQWYR